MRWICPLWIFCLSLTAPAAEQDVVLELFVRNDSDVCRQAVDVANQFATERQGLHVVVSDVTADQEALRRYWQRVKQAQIAQPVMPGFDCGGRFEVGFVDEATTRQTLTSMLLIEVFTREGCPHCRDAKRFLAELVERRPALRVAVFDVVADAEARRRMEQLAKQYAKRVTGLPVIHAGGQLFVGYQTDAVSGRRIEALFEAPVPATNRTGSTMLPGLRHVAAWAAAPFAAWSAVLQVSVAPQGDLPPPPPPDVTLPPPPPPDDGATTAGPATDSAAAAVEEIEVPYFGRIRLHDWGMPLFTLIIGLIDGFNPCAMWVLVFLLSVLVNVRSRARILAIAGTFVVISGAAYFAFMAAWLNLFMLLGLMRPLQIALGCFAVVIGVLNVKDFVAFKQGPSLSIPDAVKPGIYDRVRRIVSAQSLSLAVSAAVVLAVLVNTVELLCTAGLPALYGEILALQNFPWWKNYGYLGLYNAAYMFDDTLLLAGFVITLSHRKLQEREGRWLKLISGLVILLLGTVMIAKPEWLHWSS